MVSAGSPPTPARLGFGKGYILALPWLLMLVHVLNYLDRQVINVLAEPIKQDLGLSDTQLGLMTGFAFAVFYTLVGIPVGRFADRPRTDRVGLLAVALAAWSGMTLLCGFARGFVQLLAARIGVAVFESACTPTAHSLIGESVPPKRRASALAIYGLGIPIGALLGKAGGGALADAFGWRNAFMIVGLPGVIVAVVLWLVLKDPRRARARPNPSAPPLPILDEPPIAAAASTETKAPPTGVASVFREFSRSRALVYILTGATAQQLLVSGISVWGMVFFIRLLELSPGQAGLWIGLSGGIAGAFGTWLGGAISDRFGSRNPRHYMTAPAIGMLLTVPFYFFAWSSGNWWVVLILIFFPDIFDNLYYGGAFASLQTIMKPESRGTATAIFLFVQILLGTGLGALAYGMASDALAPIAGKESLRWVLMGGAFLYLIPAFCFWRGGVHLQRELGRT